MEVNSSVVNVERAQATTPEDFSTSVSSANQEFTTLPAAVTGLSVAVGIDGSTIDLSWQSSNGSATELKVYRHVCTDASYSDCAFEQLLATLDHSATNYTDTQFELAPYYQYSLGAVAAANEANSSVVNAVKPEVVAATNFLDNPQRRHAAANSAPRSG